MNESLRSAVCEVLDYLLALQREGVRPPDARGRLRLLRERHPDLGIDLLAEEEALDRSVHYDALLRRPGEGTISLSYCPERAVPWPLRGVHRWSESELVRVNGRALAVDAAMACLDFIWDEASIIERLVNMCLIQEELEQSPVELTDAELQQAMDRFRSAKKLFKAEDTFRWLAQHGMSQEKLEEYVSEFAIVPKLRDRIAASRVEEYFSQHSAEFDAARVARFEVADEGQARDLAEQIRTGAQDFFVAAERAFFEAAERGVPLKANLFARIERRQAEPALRDQLFAAAPGQVLGPVAAESGNALVRLLALIPARLDEHTRTAIKDILFRDWLSERRQASRIEWCWGNASTTSNAGSASVSAQPTR
jgi:putative peptide maturation system protein